LSTRIEAAQGIDVGPSVEAVEGARRAILEVLTEADGRLPVVEALDRLREQQVDELAQTYAFGLMLSRNELSVEDDVISLAQLDDELSDVDVG
jgi:hypothetical protein